MKSTTGSAQFLFFACRADVGNSNAKLVLITIANWADDQGKCWPAIETLAKNAHLSKSTVIRALDYLESKGFIHRQHRTVDSIKTSNIYTVLVHPVASEDVIPEVSERHHDVSERHQGSVTVTHNTPIYTRNKYPISKSGKFIRPSVEQVTDYCNEMGYTFDPETFVNHYNSNGWKVGRASMKCWHSACVTWQKREKGNGKTQQRNEPSGKLSGAEKTRRAREAQRQRELERGSTV